jgi:hypothetical protein
MGALPEPFRDQLVAVLTDWQERTRRCLAGAQSEGRSPGATIPASFLPFSGSAGKARSCAPSSNAAPSRCAPFPTSFSFRYLLKGLLMFDAILIAKDGEQQVVRLTQVDESQLPEGDVEVAVAYSTLNYKDALAITGASPVVRSFPMVPGIDFAGVVTASTHADYKPGDRVILNGWGVGEKHWGGLSQRACPW